jgi:hypothetical protein
MAPAFLTRHYMENSGHLNASVAFPPEKEPLVLVEYEAEWATEPVRTLWRGENFLLLVGIEPQPSSP